MTETARTAYWTLHADALAAGWRWPDATVAAVIDGDTLDVAVSKTVTLDAGFGMSTTAATGARVRMRLGRVNAPPKSTPEGRAASEWLAELLAGQGVDVVTLDPYKYGGPARSPGEWVCELTLPDGRNVSDLAVASGHAVFWNGLGPRPGG